MKEYLFKSSRLGFRNWLKEDEQKMIAISSDKDAMKYFPAPLTSNQTIAFIEKMKTEFKNYGFCYFAVDLLIDGTFIGFIGLLNQDYEAPFTPCVDIGWRLDKAHWHQGYATEGANACLTYAFHELQLKEIVAIAPIVNTDSINVMKKIGMQEALHFKHPKLMDFPALENCVCFSITATQS